MPLGEGFRKWLREFVGMRVLVNLVVVMDRLRRPQGRIHSIAGNVLEIHQVKEGQKREREGSGSGSGSGSGTAAALNGTTTPSVETGTSRVRRGRG